MMRADFSKDFFSFLTHMKNLEMTSLPYKPLVDIKLISIFSLFPLISSPYNLTAALFEETESDKYSSVVAVIKERDADRITRFEDFKGKKACFGEFGGIGKINFNLLRLNFYMSHLFSIDCFHQRCEKPRNLQTWRLRVWKSFGWLFQWQLLPR